MLHRRVQDEERPDSSLPALDLSSLKGNIQIHIRRGRQRQGQLQLKNGIRWYHRYLRLTLLGVLIVLLIDWGYRQQQHQQQHACSTPVEPFFLAEQEQEPHTIPWASLTVPQVQHHGVQKALCPRVALSNFTQTELCTYWRHDAAAPSTLFAVSHWLESILAHYRLPQQALGKSNNINSQFTANLLRQ
jgi:hypothetical protein